MKEVGTAFTLSMVAIIGCTQISAVIPWFSSQLQWIVALIFIGIPWWFLRRRGLSWGAIDVNRSTWWNYLKPAMFMALVIFPVYVLGYHVVQTQVFDRSFVTARLDIWEKDSNLSDLLVAGPKTLDKRPENFQTTDLQIWEEKDSVFALWKLKEGTEFKGKISADSEITDIKSLSVKDGVLFQSSHKPRFSFQNDPQGNIQFTSSSSEGIRFNVKNASTFSISGTIDNAPLSGSRVFLGEYEFTADGTSPWTFNRSYLWLFTILLMHIIVVGVPEEIFYRGFIQTKLRQKYADNWVLFGTTWGPSVIITSVLFALGHFLIELDPSRLIVFFPSLLFGWMMNRTKSIGSVAVFHGLCNVLLNIISRFYV